MVWAGLSIYGTTDPYFIDKKDTVNTAVYCDKILPFVKRQGNRLFGNIYFITYFKCEFKKKLIL